MNGFQIEPDPSFAFVRTELVREVAVAECPLLGTSRDVSDYALMVGVPARQIGWMSKFGEQLDIPLHGAGMARCALARGSGTWPGG